MRVDRERFRSLQVSSSDAFSSAVTRNLMTCVLLLGVSWRWVVLGFVLTFVLFIEPPVVSLAPR